MFYFSVGDSFFLDFCKYNNSTFVTTLFYSTQVNKSSKPILYDFHIATRPFLAVFLQVLTGLALYRLVTLPFGFR